MSLPEMLLQFIMNPLCIYMITFQRILYIGLFTCTHAPTHSFLPLQRWNRGWLSSCVKCCGMPSCLQGDYVLLKFKGAHSVENIKNIKCQLSCDHITHFLPIAICFSGTATVILMCHLEQEDLLLSTFDQSPFPS